ncbi:MAG: type II toxin-antitoxin system MqsA family antitoxin [Desulfitobacteriaceae bacterium]
MRCVFCGRDLVKSHETIERRIKGKLYYVKNVPANVCKFCGEVYIDDEIVSTISKMLEGLKQNHSTGSEVVDFKEFNGVPNSDLGTSVTNLAVL